MDETGCGKKDGFLSKGGTAVGKGGCQASGEKKHHTGNQTSSNKQADYLVQTTVSHT